MHGRVHGQLPDFHRQDGAISSLLETTPSSLARAKREEEKKERSWSWSLGLPLPSSNETQKEKKEEQQTRSRVFFLLIKKRKVINDIVCGNGKKTPKSRWNVEELLGFRTEERPY